MTVTRLPVPGSPGGIPDVRRWIRRRQIAADGRIDPGTVYSILLAMLMAAALVGKPVVAVVWPADLPARPSATVLTMAGLVLLAFFGILRQVGPLTVSRGDATWLLTAPVSRRTLLGPALHLTTAAALLVGGVTGVAVAGHLAARPASATAVIAGAVGGGAAAVLVALTALFCQRRPAAARSVDAAAAALGTALVVATAVSELTGGYALPSGLLPPVPAGPALAVVTLAAAMAAMIRAWHRLEGWPTQQIAEASLNTGAYADAVYAVEPSFLTEMSTRRYWRRHPAVRTGLLLRDRRVPPLVSQDLLLARRKAGRLWWLAGTALVPAIVADSPAWLLIGLVLLGALGAAGLTAETTHSDASNPALLRLIALPARQVRAQRLAVPSMVAAVWCALALSGLSASQQFTGPWWALGLAAGPAVAVAAAHRAKASAASVGNILIDTPFGAFPSGMLLWLGNGVDVLALLTLPVSVALVSAQSPDSLGLHHVGSQVIASALGCVVLLRRARADGVTL